MAVIPLTPNVNPVAVPLAPTEAVGKKSKQVKTESKRAIEESAEGHAIKPYKSKDNELREEHLGNSLDLEI